MSLTPERAKSLYNRLGEHGADIEQLLGKLNEVYNLSIESTEERINPRVETPVEVKVRNLAVARACVMDMYSIHRDLAKLSTTDTSSTTELKYELIKSFVSNDEEWRP